MSEKSKSIHGNTSVKKTDKAESVKKDSHAIKKLIKIPFVRSTIFFSAVFALIIHTLFSFPAPCAFLEHEWGAGDILTYVSTIALGVLAVWQNQKFKEENDTAQARMENLTNKANELSVVGKIIEYESERISLLKTKTENFIDACNTEGMSDDISDVATQPSDFRKTYVKLKMDSRDKRIRQCAIELLAELGTYPDNQEVLDLIKYISEYSGCSIVLANDIRKLSIDEDHASQKAATEKSFITNAYNFIAERESLLNKVIYENLSLEDIKKMYHKEEKA